MEKVRIYTDGACLVNPGKGGYAAILVRGERRDEISGGYEHTTNNRMELMACIKGLEALEQPCEVTITSDSKYVVDGMSMGWAKKWQNNNWKLSDNKRAKNIDLWQEILRLAEKHVVNFVWVRAHDGHPENERCDQLANEAASGPFLAVDFGYKSNYLSHAGFNELPEMAGC